MASVCLSSSNAAALGLGRLSIQSALGESLRAEIDITSVTPEEASNLQVKVANPEAYRAAGVDYNSVLPSTQASVERRGDGRSYLRLASNRAVQEPFVDVILELSWATGRLVREYTLLFDLPQARSATPSSNSTAAVMSAAPGPAVGQSDRAAAAQPAPRVIAQAQIPAPAAQPTPAPTPRALAPVAAPAPSAATAAAGSGANQYQVRQGDTLSRIAARTQRPGVSLEQMLVGLYRANPDAFLGNNMNLLKSGSVLAVPSAADAGGTTQAEAQQFIQAQSADFATYRQRLASGQTASVDNISPRQATGRLQADVTENRPGAAPTPDRLTLTRPAPAASADAEAAAARASEAAANATRMAELAKNVEDLRRASAASAAAAAAASAAAPAPAPAIVPPVVTAPAPAPAPVAPPPPVAEAPAPTPAPAPAPATPEGPGVIGSLLENPLALPAAGVLVALLIGLGLYRLRSSSRKDSGETSFLESRLQPDSFFGASGGQRIDTRDAAGGASSSMSYSLSQLDAIGDVDPVAEADVYLAYGRDLQAEEILKEAMRSSPDRMAVRTKLLEVYAKRRDTKGFELLATQLYMLTKGQGEDWAKAQEMGLQIDSDNALYQPGGEPATLVQGRDSRLVEPLGASTMPQSILPSPSQFNSAMRMTNDSQSTGAGVGAAGGMPSKLDLDLDLDLNEPGPSTLDGRASSFSADAVPTTGSMGFDILPEIDAPSSPVVPARATAARPADKNAPLDFDLEGFDLDAPSAGPASKPAGLDEPSFDSIGFSEDDGDPLVRKLELAEEFRQIGDTDGAKDLLQEVVAQADGALKVKAQGMLDSLN
ncbi:hypothetical protein BH09PSE5_BH09PSE5_06630 [soil metagenome]